jgi:hypothetical protein
VKSGKVSVVRVSRMMQWIWEGDGDIIDGRLRRYIVVFHDNH